MANSFTVMDMLNKNSIAGIDDSPKARFRTKDISIYKMYRNKMNFYKVSDIEELAGDILMHGLKQNLELVHKPCSEGEYRIVSGERRWEALKTLAARGYKEFEVATCKLTSPQDDDEEQVEIISANAYRTKRIADILEEEQRLKASLERMRKDGKQVKGHDLNSGRLRDVVASMMGVSRTKVAQIESVNNNLIPEFKEELNKERLTFSAAYELSGMPEDKQRETYNAYQAVGGITHKAVKDIKKEAAAAKPEGGQGQQPDSGADQGNPEAHKASGAVSESDTRKYVSYEDAAVSYGMDPEEAEAAGMEMCNKFDGYPCNIKETIKKHFTKGGCIVGCAGCCKLCRDKGTCEFTCEAVSEEMVGRQEKEWRQKHRPGDDYEPPHPESITSLCYSCKRYSDCNVKTGTCKKCDQYINKAEAEKTEEQRYYEEQDRIDRETRRKLREMADEEKMNHLPSDERKQESKFHQIEIEARYFGDVCAGRKAFELRKNDRGYRVGDTLEMLEYKDGKYTERAVRAEITFVLEGHTGLKEGYCILGIEVLTDWYYANAGDRQQDGKG